MKHYEFFLFLAVVKKWCIIFGATLYVVVVLSILDFLAQKISFRQTAAILKCLIKRTMQNAQTLIQSATECVMNMKSSLFSRRFLICFEFRDVTSFTENRIGDAAPDSSQSISTFLPSKMI